MTDTDVASITRSAGNMQLINRWLAEYIVRPHRELGRNGPVCPFVRPAQRARALDICAVEWRRGFDVLDMVRVVEDTVDDFLSREWGSVVANLRALVVTIPGLATEDYGLVDLAHRLTKDGVVARGLMLGQFHPDCKEPAARNRKFPVNRAPVPLFAIRHMSVHDILFLHANDSWFLQYMRRFGRHYDDPGQLNPEFISLFDSARSRIARTVETPV